jgi:Cu+-exporting ATPase
MQVVPAKAHATYAHDGQTYYFCCPSCLNKFRADPQRYIGARAEEKPSTVPGNKSEYTCPMHSEIRQKHPGSCPKCGMALEPVALSAPSTKVEFTCPMHPQIVRDQPGSCPICGMALEPRTVTVEEGPNPELADMSRRFWVGLVLSVPIFVLAMADMLPGTPLHSLNAGVLNWVQLVLATPVVLWCGWPFFRRAWDSIKFLSPNMFTLIALGVGAAYLYSLVATLAPGLFPEGFRMADGAVQQYFDTAAVVTVLVLLGQVLELRARSQTTGAIRRLLGMAPRSARLVRPDGREEDIPVEQVRPGDILRVRPGEKMPVDGTVMEGRSCRGQVSGARQQRSAGRRTSCGRRHSGPARCPATRGPDGPPCRGGWPIRWTPECRGPNAEIKF